MRLIHHLFIWLFALCSVLVPAICSKGQDLGQTVSQADLFSYQAPKGWTVKNTLFSKYDIAFDTPHNAFAANINVVAEQAPVSLSDYVAASNKAVAASPMFMSYKVVNQAPFETSAGLKGFRVVADDQLSKLSMRQIFYFFEGSGNNKFAVTASCLPADADHYAPIFDASMKSFSPK